MTDRTRMSFAVKEFPSGQPWIYFERVGDKLKILGNGFLGFDLPKGTTIEEARRIADYLNSKIEGISYTALGASPDL